MDRDSSTLWDQIVIDRRETVSPFRQIANSIRHKIATHQLAANTPLPSVRRLAQQVGVTPATVARAYRQLQNDGLIESLVGKGTVVSDTQHLVYRARARSTEALDAAIDAAVGPLLAVGYTPAEVRESVGRRLALGTAPQRALVVSDASAVLEKYVAILGRELAPLGIHVEGMMLDDLRACRPPQKKIVAECSRIMTALGLLRAVQEALEGCGSNVPISVVFTEIELTTIEKLSAIPKDARVLIVAERRYRNSVLGILRDYLPVDSITVARSLDPETVREGLARCSVVVHSLGASDTVLPELGEHHEAILLDYQVRRDALAKLRASFAPAGADESEAVASNGPARRD